MPAQNTMSNHNNENTASLQHNISGKIRRNTAFNILGASCKTLALLILTPYIIGKIGIEKYGVWAIVSVFTGYLGLFDFGMGQSFIKYISEFYFKKDYNSINHVVNSGFAFSAIFSIMTVILGSYLLKPLLTLFRIPHHLHSEAVVVFFFGIILFGITNTLYCFKSIQIGLQRMDITNKISIFIFFAMIGGTVYFLEHGYGLIGLISNGIIIVILTGIIDIVISFKILPELRFHPFSFSNKIFNELFRFGFKMQVTKLASLIHFQTDKLLLAYFLNIRLVTYYDVAANLAFQIRGIPLILMPAIFPAVSGLNIHTDKELIHKIYRRSMKYVTLISFPLIFLTILLAKPFMVLWLGSGYEKSALTLQILLIGYTLNIMTAPGFTILNGIGKPNYGVKSSLFAAVLNLILSIILIIKIGFFGAVYGTSLSMIAAAVYFISAFHKVVKLPLLKTINSIILKPCIASILSFILVSVALGQITPIGWTGLVGSMIAYLTIFTMTIIIFRYLDDFDKDVVSKYAHGIIKRLLPIQKDNGKYS